jgi:mono/diheme cytochrome c family protein
MRYFLLIYVITCLAIVSIAGLRGSHTRRPPLELFPDLVRQNKVRPQTPSEFFADGYSSRPIPEHAVAHSAPYMLNGKALDIDGQPVYPYDSSPVNTGRVPGKTNFIEVNPLPITPELLARGEQRFQINCLPCHGPDGDGKGITSKYGMLGVANFHDQRLINMPDGQIFNTITYGSPSKLMGPYGANVEVEDRWAIVAYVRALELSQLATPQDLTEAERATLKK